MVRGGKSMYKKRRAASTRPRTAAPQVLITQRTRGPELKCMDTASSGNISSGGAVIHLTALASGGDVFQRIGRQVSFKGVQIRSYFILTGAITFNDFVRVAVVYDRQPDAAPIAIADVYQNINNVGAVNTTSESFTNPNNWDRFTVLAEQTCPVIPENNGVLPPSGPSFNQDPAVKIYFNQYIPLKGMLGRWPSGAAGIPNTGAIYFICHGLLGGGTIGQNYVMNARVTYVDM